MKGKKEYMNELKRKYTISELIIIEFMKTPGACLTLNELHEKTGIKKNVLLVYLHRMAEKQGIISRHWKKRKDGKERLYCLKYKNEM